MIIKTSCSRMVSYNRLPIPMFKQLLSGNFARSRGNLSLYSVMLTVEKKFSDVQAEPPAFVPIASDPVTGHCWKEPRSILFALFLQVFVFMDKISSQNFFFSRLKSSSSLSVLMWEMLQSLSFWPFAGLSPVCPCFSISEEAGSGQRTPGVALPVLNKG